ncbi:MAG: hypothetical protein H0U10_02575, partial [Chloroflexia bacterium]|nr:hypothetical protein [Chloroflexia bacterium]
MTALPLPASAPGLGLLRAPGAILFVSCYELGHQPVALAGPLAVLRAAGFAPAAVDTAVEPLPDETVAAAKLVAIAVPMHTALRLGVAVAATVRRANPAAHVCFYGLYATLNAGHLLGTESARRRDGESASSSSTGRAGEAGGDTTPSPLSLP